MEKRPQNYAEIRPGIFYVDIRDIKAAELTAAMPRLEKAKGILCDLRGRAPVLEQA